MAVQAEREADLLQHEIRKADEDAARHAEEKIAPSRVRAKRDGDEHDDEAGPRRGEPAVIFCAQRVRIVTRQVGMQPEIRAQIFQRDVGVARAAQGLGVAHLDVAQNLARRLVKLRHGDLVRGERRHEAAVRADLREHFRVGKNPDAVGAPGARGVERAPGTVGGSPGHVRVEHEVGDGIVFADLPDAVGVRGAEADFGEVGLGLGIVFQLDVARQDFFRPVGAARHDGFVDGEIDSAGQHADDEIRHAQSPQTHAGSAQRGQLVMPRMLRERVEQREQQPDGQHQDEKARHHGGGVFHAVPQPELVFLHDVELAEEKVGDPENEEAAEAVGQRREQFAKQVSVVQPHGAG